MKLAYISHGNIPSKWAHTFQVVKMAQALADRVEHFELVTARSLLPAPVNDVDLGRWYGVAGDFRVVRLPVHGRVRGECFSHYASRRFDLAAALHARLVSPDLVYTRSVRAGRLCVGLGLPTVVESHLTRGDPNLEILLRIAHEPALRRFVTVNDLLRDDCVAAGFPAEKLTVWPDAVDLEQFRRRLEPRRARLELDLPVEGPLAMYCGHFYEMKGVPCLIDAAALLPKTTVSLVGGWPRDIEQMRERAGGRENLRFEGFVENRRLPDYLAAADVLVLPNSARFEHARATSPLKLFEYMAAQRPIVATRIPALAGLLRHGENAWLVAPDSPEALAEGIRRLVDDPALGARLARRAWRDVQRFTWPRRAAALLEAAGFPPRRRKD